MTAPLGGPYRSIGDPVSPRRSLVVALGVLLLAGGCARGLEPDTGAPTEPAPTVAGPTQPTPTGPGGAQAVDWSEGFVVLDNGWTIESCQGDAPILCVRDGDRPVGTVEVSTYPADGTALTDRVADLYRMVEQDRASTCGADHVLDTDEPVAATVGGAEGLRYGFALRGPDGAVTEASHAYMVELAGALYVVNAAAQATGSCPGGLEGAFTPADLDAFAAYLPGIAAGLPLPDFAG